jgi:hypothetical protein
MRTIQPFLVQSYPVLPLSLLPHLVSALRELAAREGLSLSALVTKRVLKGLRHEFCPSLPSGR